jgi:hypothetical protein
VVAIDFSDEMIRLAKERDVAGEVEYRVIDATDPRALQGLGQGTFDGALCNMALMEFTGRSAYCWGTPSTPASFSTRWTSVPSLRTTSVGPGHCHGTADSARFQRR